MAEIDMKRTTYSVVDPDAYRIGGKRVSEARTVDLTDAEAVHELRVGSIVAQAAAEDPTFFEDGAQDRKARK